MSRTIEQVSADELDMNIARTAPLPYMFALQEQLMNKYKDLGRLPRWPLDLHDKDEQTFLRELLGFLEEELFEAHEQYENILNKCQENQVSEANKHVKAYSEEIADTLHFWIELFIFSEISIQDMVEYFNQLSETKALCSANVDPLRASVQVGKYHIERHGLIPREDPTFRIENSFNYYERGANKISTGRKVQYDLHLLQCIKYLQLAKNQLKNKYWKNEETGTNVLIYQQYVAEAWLNYCVLLGLSEFTHTTLSMIYQAKNLINLERLKDK